MGTKRTYSPRGPQHSNCFALFQTRVSGSSSKMTGLQTLLQARAVPTKPRADSGEDGS